LIAGSLAKRYAKALVEVAAEGDQLQTIAGELQASAALLHDRPEVAQFFQNPGIPLRRKEETLQALCDRSGLSPLLARFLHLLLSRHRMPILPAVARVYQDLMDERLGRVRAAVTAAAPLPAELEEGLCRKLQGLLGKTVLLEAKVDPAILGGVVARVDSTVYDGSLRTQLKHLHEHLLEG
jgi:F-type H+-transporting ATPase subunit delta